MAANNGHCEVVHALAKVQWPLGKQDMPKDLHKYLPLIVGGAQLLSREKEAERIWVSAFQDKSVVSTRDLHFFS